MKNPFPGCDILTGFGGAFSAIKWGVLRLSVKGCLRGICLLCVLAVRVQLLTPRSIYSDVGGGPVFWRVMCVVGI